MATLINKILRRIFGSSKKRSDEELVHVDTDDLAQDVRVRSAPTTKPSADPLEVPVFEDRGDGSRSLRTIDFVESKERQEEKERPNSLHPDDSWFENEEAVAIDYSDRPETAGEISFIGDHVEEWSPSAVEEGCVHSSAWAPTNESSHDRGEPSWRELDVPASVQTVSGQPASERPSQPTARAARAKLPSAHADPASDPDTTQWADGSSGPGQKRGRGRALLGLSTTSTCTSRKALSAHLKITVWFRRGHRRRQATMTIPSSRSWARRQGLPISSISTIRLLICSSAPMSCKLRSLKPTTGSSIRSARRHQRSKMPSLGLPVSGGRTRCPAWMQNSQRNTCRLGAIAIRRIPTSMMKATTGRSGVGLRGPPV